jgi:predicted lipoprotein
MTRLRPLFPLAGLLLALGCATPVAAQTGVALPAVVATPYYSGEQALVGVYGHFLPPLTQAFVAESLRLVDTSARHCEGQAPLAEWRDQWLSTLVAWQQLATPAIGPVLERRSQRQIDFWPTRPELLQKAIDKAPTNLADMERVGTPAKGFPALEQLLARGSAQRPLGAADCRFAQLTAQAVAQEAAALQTAFGVLAVKDWNAATEDATTAFGEWINQWLAGLERLRWAHIGKPLETQRSTGRRGPVPYARTGMAANLADWRAQWASLKTQARLTLAQLNAPPPAGQALLPIEALLKGKGQLALAQRWAQAIDRVDSGMAALRPQPAERELLALSQNMKAVTVLYQNEVAAALDVPLGFSDADGD